MRPVPALLSLSACSLTLLAGCLDGGVEVDPGVSGTMEGDGPGPLAFPWSLTDCRFAVAFVPVDAAALAPHIPDGFTLDAEALGIESFRCASGAGADQLVRDLSYGSYFASVTPPDELAVPGVDDYYYKWWVLVPDEPRRELYANLGMQVENGEGDVDVEPTAVGPLHDAYLEVEGMGRHDMLMASPLQQGAGGGDPDDVFAEFSPLSGGGYAVWQARYTITWSASGVGTVEVPSGGWAAGIIGGTTARANINTGVWSFHDGSVMFPVDAATPPGGQ